MSSGVVNFEVITRKKDKEWENAAEKCGKKDKIQDNAGLKNKGFDK